jgi:hypothetical protein
MAVSAMDPSDALAPNKNSRRDDSRVISAFFLLPSAFFSRRT